MALTASETQQCYLAVGLKGEGNTRYRVRWNWFSVFDIKTTSIIWTYSTAKGYIDTRLTALSAGALAELATYLDAYTARKSNPSLKVVGGAYGANIDYAKEIEYFRSEICKLVGIEIEEAPPDIVKPLDGSGDSTGRLVR
jgi:hypothetical protein